MTGAGTGRIERWLRSHADAAALLIVALGFAARFLAARHSYVLSDEALHLELASPESLLGVYRTSLSNAHPPLFILLLHFWHRVVGSGWQLCLLPVAFGTAFLWAAYRWARSLFGEVAAFVTLAFLAFLPPLVLISAELRGYALALCLLASALATLERGLEKRSPSWLGLSAALTALALLTHYVALRFSIAAFVYAAVRLLAERPPALLVRTWAASQAAVAAVFLFLYLSHVSKLHGGAMEREAQGEWLRVDYLQREDGALQFLFRQTAALFRFLFASPAAAVVAGSLVLCGIGLVAAGRRPSAILLALPFALAAAGGLLGLYPYGGTRHSIDLALFACAAIGVALARLGGNRIGIAFVLAAALAPAGFAVGW